MTKVIYVDPPGGWLYGFPKELPLEYYKDKNFDLYKWLYEQGYPEKVDLSRIRFFEEKPF